MEEEEEEGKQDKISCCCLHFNSGHRGERIWRLRNSTVGFPTLFYCKNGEERRSPREVFFRNVRTSSGARRSLFSVCVSVISQINSAKLRSHAKNMKFRF